MSTFPSCLRNEEEVISCGNAWALIVARRAAVVKWMNTVSEAFQVSTQITGAASEMARTVKVKNRTSRRTEVRPEIAADPRHAEDATCAMGLWRTKSAPTPSSREDSKGWMLAEEPMPAEITTKNNAVAAKLNYMTNVRPNLRCAALVDSTMNGQTVEG